MYSYIHIPFCRSKCDYCRFASYAGLDQVKVSFYVDFLCREIEKSQIKREALKSVYFGGGTPTTLDPGQLDRILKTLRKKFGFMEDIEITLETTPENITDHLLNDWKSIGINRISMGVQSLNEKTLQEISRKPSEEIFKALKALNTGIIENISVDFIIGLPFVKKGEVKSYIDRVLSKFPMIQHISVYMLEDYYEAAKDPDSKFQNVKYPVDWSKDGLQEEEFLEEYSIIRGYLGTQGFHTYEISNFARKGYECKHNQAYWDHSEVAAFGLGASGCIDGNRYKNSDNFGDYYKGQDREEEFLQEKDIILEQIMFGLRTDGFSIELLEYVNQESYEHFIANGMLQKKRDRIILGKSGFTLLDSIILELMD